MTDHADDSADLPLQLADRDDKVRQLQARLADVREERDRQTETIKELRQHLEELEAEEQCESASA
jgi:hypothetical protein